MRGGDSDSGGVGFAGRWVWCGGGGVSVRASLVSVGCVSVTERGAKVTPRKIYDLTSVTKYARLVFTSRGGTRPEKGEGVNDDYET